MKKLKSYLDLLWNKLANLFFSVQSPKQHAGKCEGLPSGKTPDCLQQMEVFLRENYAFRFNLLTGQTEYREAAEPETAFRMMDKRDLNTITMSVIHTGINCWDRDVARYINSRNMAEYHPFRLFTDTLPAWDGKDRLEPLARRVSDNPVWVKGFQRWMLALTAQWMGLDSTHANSVAPVLVSTVQGVGKSTFWRSLLPPQLQEYYSDSYDPSNPAQAEQKLARFGLINLDEMDKYTLSRMAALKNLMQMAALNIKKAYQKDYTSLPRIASFAATSNYKELLADPTGSRRFLCVETNRLIDSTGIDHAQLYAQLKTLLLGGERYWFDKADEREIRQNNLAFYKTSPDEDVFRACFRPALPDEPCEPLTAMDIFRVMKLSNPYALRSFSPNNLGRMLSAIGVEHVHTHRGNIYKVMEI